MPRMYVVVGGARRFAPPWRSWRLSGADVREAVIGSEGETGGRPEGKSRTRLERSQNRRARTPSNVLCGVSFRARTGAPRDPRLASAVAAASAQQLRRTITATVRDASSP